MFNQNQKFDLFQKIYTTSIVTGLMIEEDGIKSMVDILSNDGYQFDDIQAALKDCCRSLKGRLTLSDIISRLQAVAIPTADELWGEVLDYCQNEHKTFVLPEIAFQACENAAVYELINSGDRIAARMAFKAAYERLIKGYSGSLKYRYALGTDRAGREQVLNQAIKDGKLNRLECLDLLENKPQTFIGLIEKIEENSKNGDYVLSRKGKKVLSGIAEMLKEKAVKNG